MRHRVIRFEDGQDFRRAGELRIIDLLEHARRRHLGDVEVGKGLHIARAARQALLGDHLGAARRVGLGILHHLPALRLEERHLDVLVQEIGVVPAPGADDDLLALLGRGRPRAQEGRCRQGRRAREHGTTGRMRMFEFSHDQSPCDLFSVAGAMLAGSARPLLGEGFLAEDLADCRRPADPQRLAHLRQGLAQPVGDLDDDAVLRRKPHPHVEDRSEIGDVFDHTFEGVVEMGGLGADRDGFGAKRERPLAGDGRRRRRCEGRRR